MRGKSKTMKKDLFPNDIPDAYDADGNLTVNSWKLFMEDELASERNETDDLSDEELEEIQTLVDHDDEEDERHARYS